MPIPTYSEWIADTKRFGHKRSGKLDAFDKALLAYTGDGKKPGVKSTSNLNALDKALQAWVADKGGDNLNTIRNHRGMVDTMLTEVAKLRVGPSIVGAFIPPSAMAAAVSKARSRQARIELDTTDCSIPVTQTLAYPPGYYGPTTVNKNFAWTVYFSLTRRPQHLEVKVRIKPDVAAALGGGAASFRSNWKTHVQSAWRGARLRVGTELIEIHCVLDFVDSGYPGPCYEVDVANPPPPPMPADWKAKLAQQKKGTVGGEVGTPHMGQWGANDRAAISHEFGHMLGCPDEYLTTHFNGVALPASIYNLAPFSNDSLMNNTGPKGRIFPRHYDMVRQQFEIWKGLPSGTVEVILSG